MKQMPNPMNQMTDGFWGSLIARRNKWIDHNFPGPSMPNSTIGVIEEMGELAHAHLKLKQGIRGNEDLEADRADAIADLIIYLLGVMDYAKITPQIVQVKETDSEGYLLLLASWVGELSYMTQRLTKIKLVSTYEETISFVVTYARKYAESLGIDFEANILSTWAQVEERDWIAYPDTGRAPSPDHSFILAEGDDNCAACGLPAEAHGSING